MRTTMAAEKILIVEDDDMTLEIESKTLADAGYTVSTASDGQGALEAFEKVCPDLVLSDLRLPGMDGLELLGRIKKLNSRVPVVLVTAYGTVDNAVHAMRLGAEDYLAKPVQPEELASVVKRTIDKSKAFDRI